MLNLNLRERSFSCEPTALHRLDQKERDEDDVVKDVYVADGSGDARCGGKYE